MKTISGNNCLEAWLNVADYLVKHPAKEDTNVIVTIENPCDFADLENWKQKYNPSRLNEKHDNLRQVINTIFPYQLRNYFKDRHDFYKKYEAIYSKSRNRSWGTYFQRLISFGKGFNSDHPNQLENAIGALQGGSPQKYFITFHLTASNVESNVRPMGPPCWQYGELTVNSSGAINLTVVYRNHDYFNKAFGNFIGLSKLLEFVCEESGRTPGQLIIHSIHAFSSEGFRKLALLATPAIE